jgi:phosphotransferase system  glucose/maltose/N-acetylglucosamine-specific IIC component
MSELYKFTAKVITQVINPLILLLSAGAFVVFVWGMFEFILNAGNSTKREEGKKAILWGIVGLVVIFGAYGIINVAIATFNVTPNGQNTVQKVIGGQ